MVRGEISGIAALKMKCGGDLSYVKPSRYHDEIYREGVKFVKILPYLGPIFAIFEAKIEGILSNVLIKGLN